MSDNAHGTMIAGSIVLAAFFGGLGTWAAFAPLDSAIVAGGVVAVEDNRKTVKHRDGGIVRQLLIREGETVEKGAVLLRLDDSEARATLDTLVAQYRSLRAIRARLESERDGLETIRFPAALLAEASGDPEVRTLLAGQRRLARTRRRALSSRIAILERKIAQSRQQILALEARNRSQTRQLTLVEDDLSGIRSLFSKGYARKSRLHDLERHVAYLKGNIEETSAGIEETRQAIREARLQIADLRTQNLAEIANELEQTKQRTMEVEPRLRAARETLARTTLHAPVSGVVLGLTAHTVGGVIGSGEAVLDIVPSGNPLIIQARVQPQDIDDLRPGMKAQIQLTAYNRAVVPTVEGTVTKVSADRLLDDKSGFAYYLAQIEVDRKSLARAGSVRLRPGMPADVIVPTGERTALTYLLGPLSVRLSQAFRES